MQKKIKVATIVLCALPFLAVDVTAGPHDDALFSLAADVTIATAAAENCPGYEFDEAAMLTQAAAAGLEPSKMHNSVERINQLVFALGVMRKALRELASAETCETLVSLYGSQGTVRPGLLKAK